MKLWFLQTETRKLKETTHKLNEAQTLLEKQLEETRKQQQKVLSAEIQSRLVVCIRKYRIFSDSI